ncbi:3974_t:CDS:2 [Funneliformis geosporum]|uniref:3974_t:CDS:1 n=1 Tax=Funneliformis geosporum TaxID=1117311 RepID=A0A9W4X3E2_9GLOM|nr:3974_t:CDS:2 [Funneliformis geosporum]
MIKNSSSIYYPTFKIPANNALQQLEIDLVKLLKKNKAGWLVNTFKDKYIILIIFDDYFERANPEKYKQARSLLM